MPSIVLLNKKKDFNSFKSLSFDGVSDYITCGNILNFERTDVFSFGAWFKTNSVTEQTIIGKWGATSQGYNVYITTSGTVKIVLTNQSSNLIEIESSFVVNDGQWHFIMVTYDGSSSASGINLYIDGILDESTITINNSLTGTIITTYEFQIGARAITDRRYFDGNIGNASVWNIELSYEEINQLFNKGTPPDLSTLSFSSNLVGWWELSHRDEYPVVADSRFTKKSTVYYSNVDFDTPGGTFSKFSWYFDGVSDYIDLGDQLDFDTNDAFSISCWFKRLGVSSSEYFVSKFNSTPVGWGLRLESTGEIGMLLYTASNNEATVQTIDTFDDGNWHHVVATMSGSGTAAGTTIYVDGVSKSLTIIEDTLTNSISNDGPLNIGAMTNGSSEFGPGNILDVTIYSKEISIAEVSDIYNSGTPTNNKNLSSVINIVGYWTLNNPSKEGSASYPIIVDNSGNSYNGLMTDMSINNVVLSSPGGTFSKFSLEFDGINDYVLMGDVLGFQYNDSFSISGWFKTLISSGYLISKRSDLPDYRGWGIFIEGGTGGAIGFNLTHDSGHETCVRTATSGYNDGNWHHITVTYDGSSVVSGIKCYIDGANISLTTVANSVGTNTILNNINVNIGARTDGISSFTGNLSDISVWDKELSLLEAQAIYNSGIPNNLKSLSFASNLVAWWRLGDQIRLDGTRAITTKDSSVVVAPEYKSIYCNQFSGDGYIFATNFPDLDNTDRFSISYWIKSTPGSTDGYIISKMDADAVGWACIDGYSDSYGYPEFVLSNTDGSNELRVRSSQFIADGYDWHHVIIVYDGYSIDTGISIYIDGIEDTDTTTISDTLSGSITNNANLNIGSRNNGTLTFSSGLIDNVSMYVGTLSSSEIAQIYRDGYDGKMYDMKSADKMIAWWRLGEKVISTSYYDQKLLTEVRSTYPTVVDLSGNDYHGTMTNMSVNDIVYDYPGGYFVKNQTSMTFDGIDDYITMGDVLDFEYTNDFSLSGWFKSSAIEIQGYMISKQDAADHKGYGISINGETNKIGLVIRHSSSPDNQIYKYSDNIGWNDGVWHHLVMTWSGSVSPDASDLLLYVDGNSEPLSTGKNTLTDTIVNTGIFNIGARDVSGTDEPFDGKISDISVYNKTLSLSEIQEIYNSGTPIDNRQLSTASNLVGYWRMGNNMRFDSSILGTTPIVLNSQST